MIKGLYGAAQGMADALQQQDVLAENLAHATVPGYRRRGVAFEASEQSPGSETTVARKAGPNAAKGPANYVDFTAGDYQPTGNPLDLAVRGDSFFVLEGPRGPVYTRNGVFRLNGDGELQNASGLPVTGTSGRITIPRNAAKITVAATGAVSADGVQVGQLQLATFADPRLTPVGTTLFSAPPDSPPAAATGTVAQGYREGSNVQVVNEMVNMIAGMRQYEAVAHSLKALSDAMQQRTKGQD